MKTYETYAAARDQECLADSQAYESATTYTAADFAEFQAAENARLANEEDPSLCIYL